MKVILAVFVIGVLTVGGLVGYLYLQNGKTSLAAVINPSPAVTAQSPTPIAIGGTDYQDPSVSQPTPTPTLSPLSVVFEAESTFTPEQKLALNQRVVKPLVDYYGETQPGELVSLAISHNTQASQTTYPYQGKAVFTSGGQLGFLIAGSGNDVEWWYPECLNGCNFSANYKTKYPEVVAKAGN